MNHIEAVISEVLRSRPDGLSLEEIESRVGAQIDLPPGVGECILNLSGLFTQGQERWLRKTSSKFDAVSQALTRFVEESGRHIFKVDSVLQSVSADMKPTEEELVQILEQMGTMELRRNGMIRVKDQ